MHAIKLTHVSLVITTNPTPPRGPCHLPNSPCYDLLMIVQLCQFQHNFIICHEGLRFTLRHMLESGKSCWVWGRGASSQIRQTVEARITTKGTEVGASFYLANLIKCRPYPTASSPDSLDTLDHSARGHPHRNSSSNNSLW